MHVGQGNNVFGYDLGFPKESFADIAGSNTVTVLEYDATVKDLLVSPEVISSASIQAGTIVTSKYSDQPIGDGKSFINELFITPGGMAYIGPNTEIDYLFLGPGAEAIMRENTSVSALYTIEESYETSGNGKVGSIYRITTDQYLDRANMHINRAIKAYESAKVA
ncbi:hypothetical protein A2Z33_00630 [Candidatus Gottesmanbacteria bacterium RBG_16_52_11]|uniref:Uncharacterized protein n=1 Tax=Candidatus Gottesmanbacteria bacterium RBG_16_52_11 TaxID=1798374 RepID=A0A1F5YN24_9BACT|nr:MAG: hypothetical protein A2Z33_00630 [Candidatus Gottesmanbacteria bacterium RBG_16_52_11]